MSDEHAAGEPVAADRSGVGFLVGYAARLTWRELVERLHGMGLDDSAYIVLVNVAIAEERAGSGLLVSDLVGPLAMKPADVDEATGRLLRLGLITMAPTDDTVRLGLTDKGRATVPAIQDEVRWLLENALSGFTYAEIDELTGYLRRMIANLGGTEK